MAAGKVTLGVERRPRILTPITNFSSAPDSRTACSKSKPWAFGPNGPGHPGPRSSEASSRSRKSRDSLAGKRIRSFWGSYVWSRRSFRTALMVLGYCWQAGVTGPMVGVGPVLTTLISGARAIVGMNGNEKCLTVPQLIGSRYCQV